MSSGSKRERSEDKGATTLTTRAPDDWITLPGTYLDCDVSQNTLRPGSWKGTPRNVQVSDGVVWVKNIKVYPDENYMWRCHCCGHFQKKRFVVAGDSPDSDDAEAPVVRDEVPDEGPSSSMRVSAYAMQRDLTGEADSHAIVVKEEPE